MSMEDEKLDWTPDIRVIVEEKLEQGLSLEEVEDALTESGEWDYDDVTTVIGEYRNRSE